MGRIESAAERAKGFDNDPVERVIAETGIAPLAPKMMGTPAPEGFSLPRNKFDDVSDLKARINQVRNLTDQQSRSPAAKIQSMGGGVSMHEQMFSMPQDEAQEATAMPQVKGFTMLNHLFKRGVRKAKEAQERQPEKKALNIYTDQIEALKLALGTLGLYSDKNPGGMPIDVSDAKRIWFGEDEHPDPIKEAEWRARYTNRDGAMDPKRVRRFVNYDGSTTWEVLNEDKTVMNRFTLGEFRGKKVFAQGGYGKYAELLKQAAQQLPERPEDKFNAVRSMFGG